MSRPSLVKLGSRIPGKAVISAPPPKIEREKVLNRQYLSRRLLDFAQILYRDYTHDTRSAVKVQGQEVKGQGYSVR